MGKKSEAPKSPDYSPIYAAQTEMSKDYLALQREQFAWAQQTYLQDKSVTDQVVESFLRTQKTSEDMALKDRQRYEQLYQPIEDELIKDAESYASPERKQREMAKAQANVSQQFDAARQNAIRNLESFGINPADTRYAALDYGMRAQQAAAAAGAGNQAADMTDATARALRSEAINIGRGYPGQIAGQYGTMMNAGTGAVNSGLATTTSGAQTMGTPAQWGALGAQGYNSATNTLNTGYQNQLAQWQANQQASSGLGSALGAAAGIGFGFMGLPTSSIGGKLLGFNRGGAVGDAMDGGVVPEQVSPSRGLAIDDVPARLTPGEFIVPDDVVQWYGEKHMYGLIEKAQRERDESKQRTGAIPSTAQTPVRPRQALEVN
jgi:hypothetical protein